MLETEVGVHLLQPPILVCQLLKLSNIRNLHATVLRFPVVVGRFKNTVLSADRFEVAPAFYLF